MAYESTLKLEDFERKQFFNLILDAKIKMLGISEFKKICKVFLMLVRICVNRHTGKMCHDIIRLDTESFFVFDDGFLPAAQVTVNHSIVSSGSGEEKAKRGGGKTAFFVATKPFWLLGRKIIRRAEWFDNDFCPARVVKTKLKPALPFPIFQQHANFPSLCLARRQSMIELNHSNSTIFEKRFDEIGADFSTAMVSQPALPGLAHLEGLPGEEGARGGPVRFQHGSLRRISFAAVPPLLRR
ncbi:MAG: hypothetical protein ACE5G9_02825 [Nitrospinales bacterium]